MAVNIPSSGLALAAARLINDWRQKSQQVNKTQQAHKTQQLQQLLQKNKVEEIVSANKETNFDGKYAENLNQRLLDMADDMAHIAAQFRSQRQSSRKQSEFIENFERVLEEDVTPKAQKLVEIAAVIDLSNADLMIQARMLFPDDSDLYLVLKEILKRKRLSSLQRKKLENLQESLVVQADPKMRKGGINCALKARLFGSTIGLTASLLRQTYRRFLEAEKTPLYDYEEWIASYGYKLRHTVIDFIEESLNTDIRSEDPSCSHAEFGYLIGHMQKLKILRTADREFISSLKNKKLVPSYVEEEAQWLLLLCGLVSKENEPREVLRKMLSDCFLVTHAERSTLINAVRFAYKRLPDGVFEIDYDKDSVITAFDTLQDYSYSAELLAQRLKDI